MGDLQRRALAAELDAAEHAAPPAPPASVSESVMEAALFNLARLAEANARERGFELDATPEGERRWEAYARRQVEAVLAAIPPASVSEGEVEAAARAIAAAEGCNGWDGFPKHREELRNEYRAMARAALEAAYRAKVAELGRERDALRAALIEEFRVSNGRAEHIEAERKRVAELEGCLAVSSKCAKHWQAEAEQLRTLIKEEAGYLPPNSRKRVRAALRDTMEVK